MSAGAIGPADPGQPPLREVTTDPRIPSAARGGPSWPVWLIAAVTFANGLVGLSVPLFVRVVRRPSLAGLAFPLGVHHWGRLASGAFGLGLMYLAYHLARRRRVAWVFAVIASGAALAAHLLKGDTWPPAIAPASLLALLMAFRARFTVRSERASIAQGALLAALALACAFVYGTVGFWLLEHRDFDETFVWREAAVRTLREFVLIGNGDLEPHTHHAVWFIDSLRVVAASAAMLVAVSLVQPVRYRLRVQPRERAIVRALLERFGGSSADYFKLWPDKSYFFDPAAPDAAIAYRTSMGVAIALGDPIGDPASLGPLTLAFERFAGQNAWSVAFHQATELCLPLYRELGFGLLKIGQEASVDLAHFASQTAERKDFRYARRRAERDGLEVTRYEPPHPSGLLGEVETVSREWLTLPGRRERGFTLGRFERAYVETTALTVLRDREGTLLAFMNEIPSYRAGEVAVDLMRHRAETPNGSMDYLFTSALLGAHARGFTRFSLGMAPFSGVGDAPGATRTERAVRELFDRLGRVFSFRGLRAYKAKFEPDWEDRYLAYRGGPVGLTRAALALTRLTER